MATADIAPHSLFILSVLGPARFTYSPLHSLAANRLWTSRLSIMEGSLTVLWQARWIDSSDPLFIFACLASPLLGWVQSLACMNSRSNHPPASSSSSNPTNLSLSLHRTTDTDKITGLHVSFLCFLKLFATWQWVMNGSSREEGPNGGTLVQTYTYYPISAHQSNVHMHLHKNDAPGHILPPMDTHD